MKLRATTIRATAFVVAWHCVVPSYFACSVTMSHCFAAGYVDVHSFKCHWTKWNTLVDWVSLGLKLQKWWESVGRSTLRFLEREGISLTRKYSDISSSDLDRAVATIKQEHPNDGERLMAGQLHSIGIVVPDPN